MHSNEMGRPLPLRGRMVFGVTAQTAVQCEMKPSMLRIDPPDVPRSSRKIPACCGGEVTKVQEQSAQPVVDLAGLGHPRRDLRSRSEDFLTYIVQYHSVEGEHGSNEFQIAHLLIDSKRGHACSSRMPSNRQ
jgi:hypothetical protein